MNVNNTYSMGKNSKIVLGILAFIIIIGGIIVFQKKDTLLHSDSDNDGRGVAGDPIDIAVDFYSTWRNAKLSTSTDPFKEGIVDSPSLSKKVSDKINDAKEDYFDNHKDPVLCTDTVPKTLRTREIYKTDSKASVMLLPEVGKSSEVSVMILTFANGLWKISDIGCTNGEEAPQSGEFSFDTEGRLLRSSLKSPFDASRWHIIYAENGSEGHIAPLFLSASSTCIFDDGKTETCTADSFQEAMHVHVKGNMTEEGVHVSEVTMLK